MKLQLGLALMLALAPQPQSVKSLVDGAVAPVMTKYGLPGMEVGIVAGGQRHVFTYGVSSLKTREPVTQATLFEIGSISKTFTATIASWEQVDGRLSWSDKTSKHLPALQGTKFGEVTLLNLATHTPGGFPLQLPDGITTEEAFLTYLRQWKPAYAPGTYRTYSNPGVGVLGIVTARAMNRDFVSLLQGRLLPALGMTSSYLDVPPAKLPDYAQGYTAANEPVRMSPSIISPQTYGIRTTAGDLLRFLEANMGMLDLDDRLQRALTRTHTGYYRVGAMTQDLIWEQYAYPVTLDELLAGNSTKIIYDATPVTAIRPPLAPRRDVLINKTGSTNGFGAYVAFVPEERLGIVILANKSYPIAARVALAHDILARIYR